MKTTGSVALRVMSATLALGTAMLAWGDDPRISIGVSPAGAAVAPGARLKVEVRLAPGVRSERGVLIAHPGGTEIDKTVPYEFTVEIPREEPPGDYKIMATAMVAGVPISSTIGLTVASAGKLVSIHVLPTPVDIDTTAPPVLYLSQQPLTIEGVFDDGVKRDLSRQPQIRLEVKDPTIAELGHTDSPTGGYAWVRGLREGKTILIVRHGEQTVEVPVRVRPAEW